MKVPPIRVLVVDDHRLMLEGVVRILRSHSDIIVDAVAATGEEAVREFRLHKPDVTLMDLQMQGMSGVEAIREILAGEPNARIVVLTMYSGEEDVFRALNAGAVAYVLKDAIPEDLVRVVRAVHAGHKPLSPEIVALFESRRGQPALTRREAEVLDLLAAGNSDREIAKALRISHRTAQVHIRSIYAKLDVHDRVSALSTAIKLGLVHIS
jgi:two-component system NarL family response regulator